MKKVTIECHKEHLGPFFKSLNEEWLKRFFVVEPIDHKVLSEPTKLINEGGQILYASIDGMVVGCVALKHHGQGVFELTKMAVTRTHQAQGIGTELMQACVECYQTMNGKKLYLESHSSLKPAIKLYQRFGFEAMPTPFESDYQRSDFYMEYME